MKQAANQSGSIRFIMMLSQRPEGTPQSKGGKPLDVEAGLSPIGYGVGAVAIRNRREPEFGRRDRVLLLLRRRVDQFRGPSCRRCAPRRMESDGRIGAKVRNSERTELAAVAAIRVLGCCGQILMTHCCRFAEASILAQFDYASMLWATILGFLRFFEVPSESVLVGVGIVIAAGIAVIWRERNSWDVAPAARTSV